MKLSKSQKQLLDLLARGERVCGAGNWQVHHNIYTGKGWYAAPYSTFASCERKGWIEAGKITEAGRAALEQEGWPDLEDISPRMPSENIGATK